VAVKKIYKERVREVKKLKKRKRKGEVERKLAQWKKEGYNVDEFFVGRKKSKVGLKKRVGEFKEQGYKL
jgi:hypothetical protein